MGYQIAMNVSKYNDGSHLQIWITTLKNKRRNQRILIIKCMMQESRNNLYYGFYHHSRETIKDITLLKALWEFQHVNLVWSQIVIHLIMKLHRIIMCIRKLYTLVKTNNHLLIRCFFLLSQKGFILYLEELENYK